MWNPDGEVYVGQWVADECHGRGTEHAAGWVYDGAYLQNKPTEGALWFEDGSIYVGQVNEVNEGLKRHGQGAVRWEDGSVVQGGWSENTPDGAVTFFHGSAGEYAGWAGVARYDKGW